MPVSGDDRNPAVQALLHALVLCVVACVVTLSAPRAISQPALTGADPAQAYPAKPVRIVNAFPPGGPSDLLARMLAQKLQEAWNKPVIVEPKIGAAGNIGMEFAAKAAPDGYTLVVAPT